MTKSLVAPAVEIAERPVGVGTKVALATSNFFQLADFFKLFNYAKPNEG